MKIRIIQRGGSYIVQYRKFFIWWDDKITQHGEAWTRQHCLLSNALGRVAKPPSAQTIHESGLQDNNLVYTIA